METLYILDLIGTFVFAISGILTAEEKQFDIVGATIIGMVTAIGGGTLRDLLIGSTPVGWMQDENYLLLIFLAIPFCYFFKKQILKLRKGIFLFDSIGIALFTILGYEKTIAIGLSPLIAILMGTVSAVFGGVLRDVMSNEIPLIFRKEIYATACVAGAISFLILTSLINQREIAIFLSVSIVFSIRIFAVRNHWSIPFKPRS